MAVTAGVTLPDEVLNFRLSQLRRDVLMQYSLDLLSRNYVSVALIKDAEALLCLLIAPRLVLSITNHVLAKCEIDAVPLLKVGITFSEFFIDFSGVHCVESIVLKDVCKVVS